jgi:hypothetical protein
METREAALTSVNCTTNCNNDNHFCFKSGWVGDRLYVFNSCQSISREFADEVEHQAGKHQFKHSHICNAALVSLIKQVENLPTNSP